MFDEYTRYRLLLATHSRYTLFKEVATANWLNTFELYLLRKESFKSKISFLPTYVRWYRTISRLLLSTSDRTNSRERNGRWYSTDIIDNYHPFQDHCHGLGSKKLTANLLPRNIKLKVSIRFNYRVSNTHCKTQHKIKKKRRKEKGWTRDLQWRLR